MSTVTDTGMNDAGRERVTVCICSTIVHREDDSGNRSSTVLPEATIQAYVGDTIAAVLVPETEKPWVLMSSDPYCAFPPMTHWEMFRDVPLYFLGVITSPTEVVLLSSLVNG